MMKEVSKSEDTYLEKIYLLIASLDEDNQEKIQEKVEDEIYKSLEKSYTITSDWIRKVYGDLHFNPPTKEELKNLTYGEDNKDISKRIKEHFFSYKTSIHNTERQEKQRKDILTNKIYKIVHTEDIYMINHLLYYKLKEFAKAIVVVGGIGCDDCDCVSRWGTYPIEEFNETYDMPPFHPDCSCSVIVIT